MDKTNIDEILCEIDHIWSSHLKVRSHFPYARIEDLGKRIIESSSYYKQQGYSIRYDFGKQLEKADIDELNILSNWLNQNSLIRLYALMNYCGFISETMKINQLIDGWKEVDLLRRLRNHFAHTDGRLNSDHEDQNMLISEIVTYFELDIIQYDHIPITINRVMEPIFEGCKKYAKMKLKDL